MLKSFTVENSHCFGDSVTLDMSAQLNGESLDGDGNPIPEQSEIYEVVREYKVGRQFGILPVAAIYGKNASGKSKLLQSLHDMIEDILGNNTQEHVMKNHQSNFRQLDTHYNICFLANGYEYSLSYTIEKERVTKERITRTTLDVNVFEEVLYDKISCVVCEDFRPIAELMKANDKDVLLFSVILHQTHFKDIRNWFHSMRNSFKNPDQYATFKNIAKKIGCEKEESFRKRMLHFLECFDLSIADLKGINTQLWIFHKTSGNMLIQYQAYEESSGTRKLIKLFPQIDNALKNGLPFLCDGLDKDLHSIVFRQLVSMFNNPKMNKRNAQLIFTAHDTIVLDSDLLRRDEVHIVDKDEHSVSTVMRLSEMEGVEKYPYMEFDYRTGIYGSFLEDIYNAYPAEESAKHEDVL